MEGAPAFFPGVELTAGDGTHLLLLMDPDREQQHVDYLLSHVQVPVDQRGEQNARSPLSVEQILKECGGDTLVVAAHVKRTGWTAPTHRSRANRGAATSGLSRSRSRSLRGDR